MPVKQVLKRPSSRVLKKPAAAHTDASSHEEPEDGPGNAGNGLEPDFG